MLTSQLFLPTLREVPAEAEIISHQWMLRAGLIRPLTSGLYTWLPLGMRVLEKVEAIVRDEMRAINAQEIRMPCVQPAELWQESQRWNKFGDQLLKMKDRHERDLCFGPTHEEVITDLIRRDIHSYKQLPLTLFQITTKFRDEIRPRFGVMRSREFLMKDAYSFHIDDECLALTYAKMYKAYTQIFTRLGLNFRAVSADTGAIGGKISHEFQVLAESGEDIIVYSDGSDYAANIENAKQQILAVEKSTDSMQNLQKIATPGVSSIAEVVKALHLPMHQVVKTLIVKGTTTPYVVLCLRGDHELNPLKAEKLPEVASPLTLASDQELIRDFDCLPGSLGPIHSDLPLIIDHSAYHLRNFCCGANETGYHFMGANWERDTKITYVADIRNVVEGEPSPDGKGKLCFARAIEVGHIFQVGTGYSEALQATVLNQQGKKMTPTMGCYGIGITRIVAAAIEQYHDQEGICWPKAMAPFQVGLVPIQYHKSPRVKAVTDQLYCDLQAAGIEVLMDDRAERPGVMFADMDLIGLPYRITIGEKNLANHHVEIKDRASQKVKLIPQESVVSQLTCLNRI